MGFQLNFARRGELVALVSAAGLLAASSASAAPTRTAADRLQESWGDVMAHTATPHQGCFTASYPSTQWRGVACVTAPRRPYVPRHGTLAGAGQNAGNGNDYVAETSNIMQNAVGSFPVVRGVRTETGSGVRNSYSLQLNSDFMNTAACNGHSGCLSWEQFIYASDYTSAFMQYWLINYGNSCPDGSWNSYQGSCYKNSNAVGVPKLSINQLGKIRLNASATAGSSDVLQFSTGKKVYTTIGPDSVVDLGTAWRMAEFNIVGDGGGSQADFNAGSSLTVKIGVSDGTGNGAACVANAGTTGETNNLNLRSCSANAGGTPNITFVESN